LSSSERGTSSLPRTRHTFFQFTTLDKTVNAEIIDVTAAGAGLLRVELSVRDSIRSGEELCKKILNLWWSVICQNGVKTNV